MKKTKLKIQHYHPAPVVIPENLALCRLPPKNIAADVVGKYDGRTIYYDVFILENPRRLVAVGPPLLNLKKMVRSAEVFVGGKKLKGTLTTLRTFCRFTTIFPKTIKPAKSYEVNFSFNDFQKRMSISPIHIVDKKSLALMTVSKNNPVHWISDWCLWHKRLHGVERIFLYDNGSDNLEILERELRKISGEIEVVLVHWNFPYSPLANDKNHPEQAGAINHHREAFGRTSDWVLSLDVDEYLATKTKLSDLLSRHRKNKTVVVRFDSYIVPADPKQPQEIEKRSIRSYTFRDQDFFNNAFKYAYQPQFVRLKKPHIAFPKNWWLDKLCFAPILYDRLARFLYHSLTNILNPENPLFGRKIVRIKNDEIYFYHFRGLNTNWREKIPETTAFDPKLHTTDKKIAALIKTAEMDKY